MKRTSGMKAHAILKALVKQCPDGTIARTIRSCEGEVTVWMETPGMARYRANLSSNDLDVLRLGMLLK